MLVSNFLKSKRLYMLFVLPFIVMAISFLSYHVQKSFSSTSRLQGVINISYINELDPTITMVLGFVMVLALAYLMFFINERYKFLSQTTTLPSFIYVLMTSGLILSIGFSYLLISVFLSAIALSGLQRAINDTKSNNSIYNFAFFISLAVLIYPKFILLVLWAICVLFFSGRSTMKDISALLLGLLTPVMFVAFYYFWTDHLEELPLVFSDTILSGVFLRNIPILEQVQLGTLLLLLLVSLSTILTYYPVSVVNQRRGILSVVSMLIFLCLTMFLIPGIEVDFVYMLALPLSYIYAQYFLTHRVQFVGNLMFILLVASCFLAYF